MLSLIPRLLPRAARGEEAKAKKKVQRAKPLKNNLLWNPLPLGEGRVREVHRTLFVKHSPKPLI
jgi:hypothetical protein